MCMQLSYGIANKKKLKKEQQYFFGSTAFKHSYLKIDYRYPYQDRFRSAHLMLEQTASGFDHMSSITPNHIALAICEHNGEQIHMMYAKEKKWMNNQKLKMKVQYIED